LNVSIKKADKAREIAQSALEQFTQRGYLATNLESIAAGAGIGKSTIYEYYKNKEELFAAAVQEAIDQWLEEVDQIKKQSPDPIERLKNVALSFVECDKDEPGESKRFHFEILMQTVMEGGVFYSRKHYIQGIHQKTIRMITDILLDGVSNGSLKPQIARDARKIAITYFSFLHGLTLGSLVSESTIDVREQISFFIQKLAPLMCTQKTAESQAGCQTEPLLE
jgi:AcrR family transcriptional regulator